MDEWPSKRRRFHIIWGPIISLLMAKDEQYDSEESEANSSCSDTDTSFTPGA